MHGFNPTHLLFSRFWMVGRPSRTSSGTLVLSVFFLLWMPLPTLTFDMSLFRRLLEPAIRALFPASASAGGVAPHPFVWNRNQVHTS